VKTEASDADVKKDEEVKAEVKTGAVDKDAVMAAVKAEAVEGNNPTTSEQAENLAEKYDQWLLAQAKEAKDQAHLAWIWQMQQDMAQKMAAAKLQKQRDDAAAAAAAAAKLQKQRDDAAAAAAAAAKLQKQRDDAAAAAAAADAANPFTAAERAAASAAILDDYGASTYGWL
jgi:hypothetical protein